MDGSIRVEHPIDLPDAARRLADDPVVRAMSPLVTARIADEVFPDRRADRDFLRVLGESVHDNVQAVLDVIAGRLRVTSAEPLGAIALMDVFAQLGEPTSSVERGYRIGQWEIWEQWVAAARREADGDPEALLELVIGPSRTLFEYIDTILTTVLARYEEQRRSLDRARDHERSRMLREILESTHEPAPAEASAVLRYDVGLTHRAVIVQSEDRGVAERALERLREALGASDGLLHMESVSSWALWLGRREAPTAAQLRRFRRELDALDLTGGVGEAAPGVTGLRTSHVQAREALRVRKALGGGGSPVAWFADVQLEALLLESPERARAFVALTLGPLAGADERGVRLRETIEAWLEAGSHVGAAALLEIHEHTVRNRLRQVEELLGVTLPARRTELAVALRLHRVLA
jgi:DNA-binding PucR family transcriptional regulator